MPRSKTGISYPEDKKDGIVKFCTPGNNPIHDARLLKQLDQAIERAGGKLPLKNQRNLMKVNP